MTIWAAARRTLMTWRQPTAHCHVIKKFISTHKLTQVSHIGPDLLRLRMAHSLMYCNQFSCPFWFDVVFDRQTSGKYTHDPRGVSRAKLLRCVSSRSITVTNRSNSLTYTVASSLVCTLPLAVITVDVLMVSNSAELKSLLLTVSIPAPESTTNSLTQPGVLILPRASGM